MDDEHTTVEQLEAEFATRAATPFARRGILMLAPADAIAFIRRARQAQLPVLGIDGFRIDGDMVMPQSDHLADFSSAVEHGDGAWDEAVTFVTERAKTGLVFEVVLGES